MESIFYLLSFRSLSIIQPFQPSRPPITGPASNTYPLISSSSSIAPEITPAAVGAQEVAMQRRGPYPNPNVNACVWSGRIRWGECRDGLNSSASGPQILQRSSFSISAVRFTVTIPGWIHFSRKRGHHIRLFDLPICLEGGWRRMASLTTALTLTLTSSGASSLPRKLWSDGQALNSLNAFLISLSLYEYAIVVATTRQSVSHVGITKSNGFGYCASSTTSRRRCIVSSSRRAGGIGADFFDNVQRVVMWPATRLTSL